MGMRIEYLPLEAILRWPRNPKEHALVDLDASMTRFGYVQPLLIDEGTGQLVAGHGRLETLQKRKAAGEDPPDRVRLAKDGDWLVPVIRGVSFANIAEAEAYLLADNRLPELGGWDPAGLAEFLGRIRQLAPSSEGIGWNPAEMDKLIKAAGQGEGREERGEVPETGGHFDAGEIKQLVFFYDAETFEKVLDRMRVIMERTKLGTHTDVFLALLEHYELSKRPRDAQKAN